MRRRKGNPYLGIKIEDTRTPQDYIIKKRIEPLVASEGGYVYEVYLANGTPMYMSELTLAKTEERLRKGYPVKSIKII